MEGSKEHVEMLFEGLLKTNAVEDARNRVQNLMDKYYVMLLNQGETPQAAQRIVLNKFQSLHSISDTLKINEEVWLREKQTRPEELVAPGKHMNEQEIHTYLNEKNRQAHYLGIAVFLIGISLCPMFLLQSYYKTSVGEWTSKQLNPGFYFFLFAILVAIFLLVRTISIKWKWRELNKHNIVLKPQDQINLLNDPNLRKSDKKYHKVQFFLFIIVVASIILMINNIKSRNEWMQAISTVVFIATISLMTALVLYKIIQSKKLHRLLNLLPKK